MAHRFVPTALVTLLAVTVLSGCTLLGGLGRGSQGTEPEHRQADAALARWTAAAKAGGGATAFVPVGELTGQIGDWEEAVGDNNKRALMAGLVVAKTQLPTDAPAEALVRWPDGSTKPVKTVSAAQALADIARTAASTCQDCVPLQATAARLTTASIATSRGTAIAPAWEFTLDGTKVHLTRIAVAATDGTTVQPPAWDPNDAPVGISIDSARGTVTGTELIVTFVGAPDPASKPCGEDYTGEAVESDTAVVVIVVRHANPTLGACSAVGAIRTAVVTLAAPLGERAVLEVQEGLPVSVTLDP